LSVYDGDKIQPLPSWEHYRVALGFQSVGVLAVTLTECTSLELPVVADGTPFPEHCYIDFSGLIKNEMKKKAKVLAAHGESRGWLLLKPLQT
jgi:hypothetical protein